MDTDTAGDTPKVQKSAVVQSNENYFFYIPGTPRMGGGTGDSITVSAAKAGHEPDTGL